MFIKKNICINFYIVRLFANLHYEFVRSRLDGQSILRRNWIVSFQNIDFYFGRNVYRCEPTERLLRIKRVELA